jgi:hypothetical protein
VSALQTWLLYHNALSSGVAIEDILKFARKTKEKAGSEEGSIVELKAQVAQQERLIRQLMNNGYGATDTASSTVEELSVKAEKVVMLSCSEYSSTCPMVIILS